MITFSHENIQRIITREGYEYFNENTGLGADFIATEDFKGNTPFVMKLGGHQKYTPSQKIFNSRDDLLKDKNLIEAVKKYGDKFTARGLVQNEKMMIKESGSMENKTHGSFATNIGGYIVHVIDSARIPAIWLKTNIAKKYKIRAVTMGMGWFVEPEYKDKTSKPFGKLHGSSIGTAFYRMEKKENTSQENDTSNDKTIKGIDPTKDTKIIKRFGKLHDFGSGSWVSLPSSKTGIKLFDKKYFMTVEIGAKDDDCEEGITPITKKRVYDFISHESKYIKEIEDHIDKKIGKDDFLVLSEAMQIPSSGEYDGDGDDCMITMTFYSDGGSRFTAYGVTEDGGDIYKDFK